MSKLITVVFILLSNNITNLHKMQTSVDIVSGRSNGVVYLYESVDGKYWFKCSADSLILHGAKHELKDWNIPVNRTLHYRYSFKADGFDLKLKTYLY